MFSLLALTFLSLLVAASLLAMSSPAEAHGRHHHHARYYAAVRTHHASAVRPATAPAPCFLFGCLAASAQKQAARTTAAPAVSYGGFSARVSESRIRVARVPNPVAAVVDGATAVYDIVAKVITLPSGQHLEAHSGLGAKRDDPRYASVRMAGPTPPHVYELTPRERLFHGVAALRLNPVGGSGTIYGRAGLLAHSCMLGGGCDSNGCVSIRDYATFLQAYRRGEFRRLVVVAGAS
jgi:hypothetical protein